MLVTIDYLTKVKTNIKDDACMKSYDEMKPLYMKTDVSEIGLGPPYCKSEKVQAVLEMMHLTTIYCDQ